MNAPNHVDPRLVAYLDHVFPDKCPPPGDTFEQAALNVAVVQGTRQVIEHLQMLLAAEREKREVTG